MTDAERDELKALAVQWEEHAANLRTKNEGGEHEGKAILRANTLQECARDLRASLHTSSPPTDPIPLDDARL